MRILYVTTISLTMNTFFKPHIEMLVNQGNKVDLACNSNDLPIDSFYAALGCRSHQIDFSRSPLSRSNIKAYAQLKALIERERYDIVHCHTPNASVITRLVCRQFRGKAGLRVFYTAHGFHFFKGAPLLNWLVYYPVEKLCSRWTDKLITINQEDYLLAKRRFHAREVYHVPGVGIDFSRFENVRVDRAAKRREIGVPEDAFLLLSVGELNENKNHQIIIKALAKLRDPQIHYAIAGMGEKRESLSELAKELGVSDRVHLLGYRKDIPELNYSADVFCFPSYREGLGLAAIEAMACGLPILTSNIHGINDYSVSGVTGYKYAPEDVEGFMDGIRKCVRNDVDVSVVSAENRKRAKQYEVSRSLERIREIYALRQ